MMMYDGARVSIIIPVYNVQEYLDECMQSVLSQTYSKIEVILIDDGSTDSSGRLCDRYVKDSRVRVIHKKNGGLSDARNTGIDYASGEFLTFVDSDDIVEESFVEKMYNAQINNNADIVISSFRIRENGVEKKAFRRREKYRDELIDRNEAIERMLLFRGYTYSTWAKLYKKELFKGIRFPKGRICEDLATTYRLFLLADRFAFISDDAYIYRFRRGSIQTSIFDDRRKDEFYFANEMKKDLDRYDTRLGKIATCRVVSSAFHILMNMDLNDEQGSDFVELLEKAVVGNRREMIISEKIPLKIRLGCVLSYLGIKNLKRIYDCLGVNGNYY